MKKRILLVEDEPIVSFAESKILEKNNYEVICASTGEEAVDLFLEKLNFDLILMDIDLGKGIDGIETAKRILNIKEVPIVFLSAHTEPDIVAKTEEVTSYGYIVKTDGEMVLLTSIKKALRLFEAKIALDEKNQELEAANEELQSAIEELESTNEELARSQEEILSRDQVIDFERKQLLERDRMMHALFNVSLDSMYLLKIDGTIEMANEIGVAKFGLLPDEARGKNFFDFFEPSVSQNYSAMVRKSAADCLPIRFVNHHSGGVLENSVYPVVDENGVVEHVAVFAADITEKKRIEDELKKSEEKYRAIVEHAGELIVIAVEGKLVYVNPKTCELLGYDAERLYSMPLVELVHPDDREMVFANYARRIKGEPAPSMYDFRVVRSTGEVRHVEIRPVVMPWEDGIATMNMLTDITERKKLQKQITSQVQFLENLLEAIPYPVFYKDTEGRYLGCNRAFADFLGMRSDDIVGKTVFEVSPRELAEIYHEADTVLFRTGGHQRYESKVLGANGVLRDVIFQKAVFHLDDGTVGGIIGTIIDITEQKKAEEKLLYVTQVSDINRERAEKLLEEKEMLLKEVHHRIKNNLSTIISLLELQAYSLNDQATKDALNNARNRVKSMVILYDKLYTTQYYKNMPLSQYLDSLVRGIVSLYPTGNKVRVSLDVEPIELSAKKMMPLGILVNELVANSMKYAFAGRESGEIKVSATKKNGSIVLTVSDDGPGLPADVCKGKSNGFGLELVQLLTKQLKGNMRIVNDEGAIFIVEFEVE